MSGETEADPSGWTPDQLAQHYNRILDAMDRRYEQRFVAQEKAVQDAFEAAEKAVNAALVAAKQMSDERDSRYTERAASQEKAVGAALQAAKEAVEKAEKANEKRFESVNEFRSALSDQSAGFLPRNEYNARHETLEQAIQEMKGRMDKNEGRSTGLGDGWGYLIGAVGMIIGIAGFVLALIA